MSDYIVTELGIKAFVEGSRIDFILQTPGVDPKLFPRVTCKASEPEAELSLAGKNFSVVSADNTQIIVDFGTRTSINLGRCTKSAGKPSYYRGLEPSNTTHPRTEEALADVLSAWGSPAPKEDQGPEGESREGLGRDVLDADFDDDNIPF